MLIPQLPSRDGKFAKEFDIVLKNEILNENEFNLIINNPLFQINLGYTGSSKVLNILLQQLSQIRHNHIILSIDNCTIDSTVCLPFSELSDNIKIKVADRAKYGAGFNNYLINCNEIILKSILPKLDEKTKTRIISERRILKEFLIEVSNKLKERKIDLEKLSNQSKMDFFYKIILDNYKYDRSITGPGGIWLPEITTELGGTAKVVYERGKGVCEGISKLLKLVTNNNEIKLPCYIIDGRYGKDGHTWNEFINDDGTIIEYDTSFDRKCTLDELEKNYKLYHNLEHEEPVEKILKR